ncbi:hypothetical protein EXU57_14480 [Segetibacter sp. 3557_3]|uniref:hypothetical protein n=1 Tax=Segetibacter sp. 3557_3 TaxID=2547429 RepID=UPI001058DF5A|nr:hypothetical protein [Segetibacter sp. 3557_3]TDH24546.1 hypothetical protein EXU57_14480 [Segetibacter sp. 3557_3]
MNKPVTPAIHGIVDYVFSGIQIAGPAALGLDANARNVYMVLGGTFGIINALTDTPAAIKPVLSMKTHQKTDAAFLLGLAALSFAGFVRKHRKTRTFHLAFLATAVTNYVLTDYNADTKLPA